MERTRTSLMVPAIKIHDSLTLGLLEEETSTGITKRETKTAKRGLIEIMVSIYFVYLFIIIIFIFTLKKEE